MPCLRPITALLLAPLSLLAAGDDDLFFESKVRPVLIKRCYDCHSTEKKTKGGLALDTRAGWQHGGDNGPAIVPGDLTKSLVIKAPRFTHSSRMATSSAGRRLLGGIAKSLSR